MTPEALEALYGKAREIIGKPGLSAGQHEKIRAFYTAYRASKLTKDKSEEVHLGHYQEALTTYEAALATIEEIEAHASPEPSSSPATAIAPAPEHAAAPPDAHPADGYPDHTAAGLFPMMSELDLASLSDDLRANGQQEDIVIFEKKVVDGRNRQRACLIAGLAPRYREWTGTGSVVSWVLSRNLHRRHLTDQQRAMVAAAAKEAFAAEAEERRLANLLQNKGSTDGLDPGHRKLSRSAQRAADELGVSRDAVNKAATVLQSGDKTLIDAVHAGQVSLDAASVVAGLPVEEQKSLVAAGEVKSRAARMRKEKKAKAPVSKPAGTDKASDDAAEFPNAASANGEPVAETPEEGAADAVSTAEPAPGVSDEEEEAPADDPPAKWAEHAKFAPVVASLTVIASQSREVLRLLPSAKSTRVMRLLVSFIDSGIFDVRSGANELVEEHVGGLILETALEKLPPEGEHAGADAIRAAVRRHHFGARPTPEAWALGMSARIEKLLGDADAHDDSADGE